MARDAREVHRFRSTRCERAWYDEKSKTIEVEFVDGTHWLYRRCSPDVWRRFTKAKSAGRFVNEVLDHFPNRVR